MIRIAIALVHHPVLDRDGGTVTTAITNLDLHDMARSARTYGVERLYVTHPVAAQRALAERIREHWVEGSGKRRIPDRAIALDALSVVASLDEALDAFAGGRPGATVWATAASMRGLPVIGAAEARAQLEGAARPVMIVFGTGWGLAPEIITGADALLEPIRARVDAGYNHLSVRAACAILLDRLLG